MNRVILIIGLCLFCLPVAKAQTADVDASGVLRQLISMPAPTPRSGDAQVDESVRLERPADFFDKDKAPADDAPIKDLLEYWDNWHYQQLRTDPSPSAAVRERLMQACEADPEKLPDLLRLLPEGTAGMERVKKLYDAAQNTEDVDQDWLSQVRSWLILNSNYFLVELRVLANKAKDDGGYVNNEEALKSLAQQDWSTAEPLLQSLAVGSQPRTSTLALTILYRKALETKESEAEQKYRERLQAIVSDVNAPGWARNEAIETLSLSEWTGRDDWYISILADETLRYLSDDANLYTPLTTLFETNPDKWIPVMTRLVGGQNRAAQLAAALCLVSDADEHPRRDAVMPLLRWLSDPDWLDLGYSERQDFISAMSKLNIPESVPGLLWIVENDDGSDRSIAAAALSHYKSPRAVTALKKALNDEADENLRTSIVESLITLGGISDTEQVAALEAYAAKLTTSEGREELKPYRSNKKTPLPVAVSIGKYLSELKDPSSSLVQALVARAEDLRKGSPDLSRALFEIVDGWRTLSADLDVLRRIGANAADAQTIASVLERPSSLKPGALSELQLLASSSGIAKSVGIVLLADENMAGIVLISNDQIVQTALLACARLTQMPLPVVQVGALLRSKNALLSTAAEKYLLAEDSKEARELLWAHHPNESFITGWRENISLMAGSNFDAIGKAEDKLRGELLSVNGPLEIFAFLVNEERPSYVVRVYADRTVFNDYNDDAFYSERTITNDELTTFMTFVKSNGLEDFGPQIGPCHHTCMVSEFLSLNKTRGRRVFSHAGHTGWITVLFNFQSLGKGENCKTHFYLESDLKGHEILLADDKLIVKDVWQQGADLRVYVEREKTGEDFEQNAISNYEFDNEADESKQLEQRRREAAQQRARYSWHKFSDGKLGALTQQPANFSTFDDSLFDIDYRDFSWGINGHFSEAVVGDSIILAGNGDHTGLWRKSPGQQPVLIGEKEGYTHPIVTPDGKWVVVARRETNWSLPHYLVRFDLRTMREYRVDLPGSFEPVTYLAGRGKVLIRRVRDTIPEGKTEFSKKDAEFFLLNASTGETEVVSGDFAPLLQDGKRFLQPAGKPNEYWAAIPDHTKNQSQVGLYNLNDFSFHPLLTVPHIRFNSKTMWVDEAAAKLYIVYHGLLLRLPLRKT